MWYSKTSNLSFLEKVRGSSAIYTQRPHSGRGSLYSSWLCTWHCWSISPSSVMEAVEIFFHYLWNEKGGGTTRLSTLPLKGCPMKPLPSETWNLKRAQFSGIKNSLDNSFTKLYLVHSPGRGMPGFFPIAFPGSAENCLRVPHGPAPPGNWALWDRVKKMSSLWIRHCVQEWVLWLVPFSAASQVDWNKGVVWTVWLFLPSSEPQGRCLHSMYGELVCGVSLINSSAHLGTTEKPHPTSRHFHLIVLTCLSVASQCYGMGWLFVWLIFVFNLSIPIPRKAIEK